MFVAVIVPPMNRPPPIPTPPATCRAPVLVDVTAVVLVIVNTVLIGLPGPCGPDGP